MPSKIRGLLFLCLTICMTLAFCTGAFAAAVTRLSESSISLTTGESYTLKLKNPEAGKKIRWSSTDKNVATVRKGVVEAKAYGTCKVTALCGGKRYTCHVTVGAVSLNRSSITLVKHRTTTLKVTGTSQKPVWTTTNRYIAAVDEDGMVTAGSAGRAKITAVCGSVKLVCTVHVVSAKLSTLQAYYDTGSRAGGKGSDRILLCGSSSVDRWGTAAKAFAPYEIINMGISKTIVTQWEKWTRSLIAAYKPAAVVVYVGGNDINAGRTGKQNAANTIRFLKKIRSMLKTTPIFYVSLVPNWRRMLDWDAIKKSNKKMKRYCNKTKNMYYVDIASYFMKDGKVPNTALSNDGLHPNSKGYDIWNRIIPAAVKAVLEQAG